LNGACRRPVPSAVPLHSVTVSFRALSPTVTLDPHRPLRDSEHDGRLPPTANEPYVLLLAGYVTGVVTTEERVAVEARLHSDAEFRSTFQELLRVWESAGTALRLPVSQEDVDRAWLRLEGSLPGSTTPARPVDEPIRVIPFRPRTRQGLRWPWGMIAASLLAVLGLSVWQTGRWRHPGVETAARSALEYAAAPGQRLSIALDDGTHVVPGPGSQLRVLRDTESETRQVLLGGRAYFTVAPDPARPFQVLTQGAVTRVLGTEFDVQAYPGDAATRVVVRSGRVAIRGDAAAESGARVLEPGDRGVVSPDGAVQVESGVDADALLLWTTGTLAFRNTPLREVIPEIERWFDVRIRMADPTLARRRITATFRDDPLDMVLQTLAELTDAQVHRTGREVVFSPLLPQRAL
jgi:transmembrane sensor